MVQMLSKILKDRRLRRRLLYTLLVVAVSTAIAQIPVYGISSTYMSAIFSKTSITGFMNTLSGGALGKMSMGGFGITSYITASIVIQLLTVIFPSLETLRKDGERGKKIFEKAEFWLSMIITLLGSIAVAVGFGKSGLFIHYSLLNVVAAVVQWMIGAYIIIKLALGVEDHGIGNGPTLILGFNILSGIPSSFTSFVEANIVPLKGVKQAGGIAILAVALLVVFILAVYLQTGMDNIPLKVSGKKASVISADGRVPVSVNVANVLPVIYASTLASLPYIIVTMLGVKQKGAVKTLVDMTTASNWYAPTKWTHVAGLVIYLALFVWFAYYSADLAFSADEIADTMRKNGDVIPGVEPGKATVKYLSKRKNVMTFINIIFLLLIVTLPDAICTWLKVSSMSFVGTSLIIVISMIYDERLRLRAALLPKSRKYALFPATKHGKKKGKKKKASSQLNLKGAEK